MPALKELTVQKGGLIYIDACSRKSGGYSSYSRGGPGPEIQKLSSISPGAQCGRGNTESNTLE